MQNNKVTINRDLTMEFPGLITIKIINRLKALIFAVSLQMGTPPILPVMLHKCQPIYSWLLVYQSYCSPLKKHCHVRICPLTGLKP